MKITAANRVGYLLLTSCAALVFASCAYRKATANQPHPASQWQVGMAEVDITPPVGFRMAGYFDERLSTGVHDPLMAKAMVLQQNGQRAALVFCDLVGLSLRISREARIEASRATGIPVTNIVIAATHSHTGPLFDDPRRDYFHREAVAKFGHDPLEKIDFPKFLTERLVQVIVQAEKNLQPAQLDAGVTTQPGYPFNRRYYMKNGTVVFNPGLLNPNIVRPAGPIDSDVDFILAKNALNEKPIGGLTVFAMHCDTTGGTLFSADFPYSIQQTLRGAFGDHFISAFGAGTCGNLNHVDVTRKVDHVSGIDIAQKIGDKIGNTILAEVPELKPIEKPALAVRSRTLLLPLQTVTPHEVVAAQVIFARMRDPEMNFFAKVRADKDVDLSERGTNWPMEVQVFRLGDDTAIVCLPAEIFVEFGLAIKAASPFKHTFVITICNQRPGYVPTLKAFTEGAYEVINSRIAPGGGEKMVEAAIKMLNELKREEQ